MAVKIKWFPPSWVQIRTGKKMIYIDPAYLRSYYRNHPTKIEFSKWPDPIDGLPEDLEKGDVILFTHHHKDHCKKVTVNRIRQPKTVVAAPKMCTRELGKPITIVRPGQNMSLSDISINIVDAYNHAEGSSTRKVHHKGDGVGYIVKTHGKSVYHAGDTDCIPEMDHLGRIDVALLPIGGTYTMDLQEAVAAAIRIQPKVAIPMHHNKADPLEFKRVLERDSNIRVAVLTIGETYIIR
jgi:L-ascorbate metabolism protein UlaG (beta-lactamase superfamily)